TRNGAVDSQVKFNPLNNLIYGQHCCGKGRNARGIITVRHRGGGHKHIYGRIVTIEYNPNRNANICLIHYGDGEKRYILHPRGSIIADSIVSGKEVPIKMGNALPLSAQVIEFSSSSYKIIDSKDIVIWKRENCFKHRQNQKRLLFQREEDGLFTFHLMVRESTSTDMPLGTAIHNIEITLGMGRQLPKAVGAVAKLIAKEGKSATIKLPSGEVRLISKNCSATVGQVGNVRVNQKSLGRAKSKGWLGKRLVVRGVVMNPVDHSYVGGERRAPIGRKKPTSLWGYPALGRRSIKRNKYSDNLIVRRQSK
ncbi:hypothetical protein E1A91_D07G215200v1, partial [Gossypium mustelinum]